MLNCLKYTAVFNKKQDDVLDTAPRLFKISSYKEQQSKEQMYVHIGNSSHFPLVKVKSKKNIANLVEIVRGERFL